MTIRTAAVLTSLVAIAVLSVAGCGGDDGDGGPSKEEFIAQADAICAKADTAQGAIPGESGGAYQNFSDARYLSRHNAITRDALVKLKALDAPDEDKKGFDEVLSALQGTVTAIDKQIAALRARDLRKQSEATREFQASYGNVNSAAGTLGLSRCQGLAN